MNYPETPGYKVSGPSRESAQMMANQSYKLRGRCMAALTEVKEATADEIASTINESILSVRPRFSELVKMRAIVATGERRKNESGHNATVWRPA